MGSDLYLDEGLGRTLRKGSFATWGAAHRGLRKGDIKEPHGDTQRIRSFPAASDFGSSFFIHIQSTHITTYTHLFQPDATPEFWISHTDLSRITTSSKSIYRGYHQIKVHIE
jgi:hypothetical protein